MFMENIKLKFLYEGSIADINYVSHLMTINKIKFTVNSDYENSINAGWISSNYKKKIFVNISDYKIAFNILKKNKLI